MWAAAYRLTQQACLLNQPALQYITRTHSENFGARRKFRSQEGAIFRHHWMLLNEARLVLRQHDSQPFPTLGTVARCKKVPPARLLTPISYDPHHRTQIEFVHLVRRTQGFSTPFCWVDLVTCGESSRRCCNIVASAKHVFSRRLCKPPFHV